MRKINEAAMHKKNPSSDKSRRILLRRRHTERDKDRCEVSKLLFKRFGPSLLTALNLNYLNREKSHFLNQFQVPELHQGLIRVQAPLHAKISMAIQLDSETKARDVMARFDLENGYVKAPYRIQHCHYTVDIQCQHNRYHALLFVV